ncbi:MAG: CsoS2 family carboxysome shell protein [Nitrosomonadaceae bacterium]
MSEIISKSNVSLDVPTGRSASRMRRAQLVFGKAGLSSAKEGVRMNEHNTENKETIIQPAGILPSEAISSTVSEIKLSVTATKNTGQPVITGRDASRARRAELIQGKNKILEHKASVTTTNSSPVSLDVVDATLMPAMVNEGRLAAQAIRIKRRDKGQTKDVTTPPKGRLRNADPIQYSPKVAESESYAGHKVTGVRIGRGENVTGNERGSAVQVTGIQYIGKESGYNPREGGTKVGASKTEAGQIVTGSQVRSKINITGDESNPALHITGASDQELNDDLSQHQEQGSYAQMQFQRQNNPHGHTVFGTNLGRSIKSAGSRNRDTEYKKEETVDGHAITGTAVGRSELTTGDENGACRDITGNQYLMPAEKQPLCKTNKQNIPKIGVSHTLRGTRTTGTQTGQRIHQHGDITGTVNDGLCQNISGTENFGVEQYTVHCGVTPPAASSRETIDATTWSGQRVTGVDVEHNEHVTGDEYGACNVITGTPYVGPNQYQTFCSAESEEKAEHKISSEMASDNFISGDVLSSADHVTGTQRGSEHTITGTPYYKADPEGEEKMGAMERIKKINNSFSVHSPQRQSQERVGTDAVNAPTAESRITGTFSVGEGKITGNQEFRFNPRTKVETISDKSRVTGEGRVEGKIITGSAWISKDNVTGTEGHIAAERNPSQRKGDSHAWAGARKFKNTATRPEPTHHVTGMIGWSPKASVPITMSGGVQG